MLTITSLYLELLTIRTPFDTVIPSQRSDTRNT